MKSNISGFRAEAKRLQLKLLDLFSLMVNAPNFPKGFHDLRATDELIVRNILTSRP